MAEIPNSDTPSAYASSSIPQSPTHNPYDGLLSDGDSSRDGSEEHEDSDLDLSIDLNDLDDDDQPDSAEQSPGEEDDEDEDEDFFDHDLDFDDDLDMRDVDVDLDFGGFGFPDDYEDDDDDERLFVDDYLDFPDEFHDDDQFNVLQQAFIHQLEHQLAHEPWGAIMDHHPHPAQPARPGPQRDQLVQVEVGGQANAAGAAGGSRRQQRQPPPDIIDLTGDDSPEMQQPRPPRVAQPRQSENQRRLRSQPQNAPPRLNRSDGSYVDDQQHVIVLSDSDDEDQPMRASPRRNPHRHAHHHNHPENNIAARNVRNARFGDNLRELPRPVQAHPLNNANGNNNNNHLNPNNTFGRLRPFSQLIQNSPLFHLFGVNSALNNHNHHHHNYHNHNHNPDDDIVITGERNVGNFGPFAGPRHLLGIEPIHLDYGAHPFPAIQPPPIPPVAPPKPAHEPPKPARPGFTRDTGEDVVAICPSCEQELAYDPVDDDNNPSGAAPKKSSRSKKAMAEHHFWAVKACGHVYCKRCFDNRRATAKSNVQVAFRAGDEKKILCAVEDCDSEVSGKAAWVGIFM
ncbi:hypothetical protein F5B22DRAFT_296692 [Xylaria bambusicola]|uniref:uncharacterized protein n=1 Tax=Xylaria bambusicola TaxID=326684 RepID=UPI0020081B98|nr:uncharacterized protein F5B22DRAFT_296692 [Xylaria bambusicola]KAI0512828.1 hypothetical protein F5B22DRAFT_296692 [Xylaria bambusicola]